MPNLPPLHNRRTIRLRGYDYRSPGAYFVTLVVEGRLCLFGDVRDGSMQLSPIGQIAAEFWMAIPDHFPHTALDAWVVMPNHLHGIVVITDDRFVQRETKFSDTNRENFRNPVSGSLSTILRSYKSVVTKQINGKRHARGSKFWQGRFFEHIIRDEPDLDRIREYIDLNPANWASDSLNQPSPNLPDQRPTNP